MLYGCQNLQTILKGGWTKLFFISNWIGIVMQNNQRKEFKINSTILYMNPSDVTEVKVPR